MQFDSTKLHWLYRETANRVAVYAQRVKEGSDVMSASEFARWLRFSGLLELFKLNPQGLPLEVEHDRLKKAVDDLLWDCGERLRRAQPGMIESSQLERVNHKLDVIAGQLMTLSPPVKKRKRQKRVAVSPALSVIPGGVTTQ